MSSEKVLFFTWRKNSPFTRRTADNTERRNRKSSEGNVQAARTKGSNVLSSVSSFVKDSSVSFSSPSGAAVSAVSSAPSSAGSTSISAFVSATASTRLIADSAGCTAIVTVMETVDIASKNLPGRVRQLAPTTCDIAAGTSCCSRDIFGNGFDGALFSVAKSRMSNSAEPYASSDGN